MNEHRRAVRGWSIVGSAVFFAAATTLAGGAPKDSRSDAELVAYIEGLRLWSSKSPAVLSRLQEAGIDEELVDSWLTQLQGRCLENPSHCETLGAGRSATGKVTDELIELLGAIGTARSSSLLDRLAGRGAFLADAANRHIAARDAERRHFYACPAPTDEEVHRAQQLLAGFPVLARQKQQLTARLLTAEERSDLAYFLVATDQSERKREAADGGRAAPSAQCGTAAGLISDEATKNFIVRAEASRKCRTAVMARMLRLPADGLDETEDDVYGTAPLQRAGFDVERLYRGALLSVHHGAPDDEVRAAVNRQPAQEKAAMLAYLSARGHPDWESETRALEGWADLRRRAALPRLLELAGAAELPVRLRALHAIEQLAARSNQACGSGICRGWITIGGGESAAGRVKPLDTNCDQVLTAAERDELAKPLLALANESPGALRAAVAQCLGAIGAPLAREVLASMTQDPEASGQVCRGSLVGCQPYFPVRPAAAAALTAIDELEASRARELLFAQAHPDASGGHFISPASQRAKLSPTLQGLMDAAHRDETFCNLIKTGKHRTGSVPEGVGDDCAVNHVLIAPQAKTGPAVVVFKPASWAHLAGPGKPKGPVVVFDAEGFQLPFFENAYDVDAEDDVFSYRRDGSLAFGLTIEYSEGAKSLHVVPVAPHPTSILTVELAPTDWSWRLATDGPGLPPRIEVGKEVDLARNAPAAIYRWSESKQVYDGPPGGAAHGYQRDRDPRGCKETAGSKPP